MSFVEGYRNFVDEFKVFAQSAKDPGFKPWSSDNLSPVT